MKLNWNRCFHCDAVKRSVAGLMLFLWLLTTAMAVCPALHELIHKDADDPHHQCAVTVVIHGNFLSSDTTPVNVVPVQTVEISSASFVSVLLPAISYRPDFGRAPPASFSSLI